MCVLEADIFFWESRGMGNKIATNHVIGTGEEETCNREWAGPGIVMIPNFTQKYTFYINKL